MSDTSDSPAAPASKPSRVAAAPVDDGNAEFPMNFERFAETLKGTKDRIFTTLLRQQHGHENHTAKEWTAILHGKRNLPAR